MIPLRSTAAKLAATAVLALFAGPALASFHLFQINEIYSNASGTVQYVELTALAADQQTVSGHTLVVSNGSVSTTCNASNNLPSDTSGRKMLFGTAGVQGAFDVTPDFICADSFLFRSGGTINWGEGSSIVAYFELPSNGKSLNLNGSAFTEGPPTPQNFGPATPPPTTTSPAYQGMWWANPAGSESGWGVNTAHQGDTIFATWFTYGPDGKGLWLIMSNATKTANGVYSGPIYTTRGPPYYASPFNPSEVVATEVGTGTFSFTSTRAGTFSYTVNGISQTKQIVRYEFSSPVPTCTVGGLATPPINYQDLWWKLGGGEAGWGLNIVHQGEQMFLTWFTYAPDGSSQWLVMPDMHRTVGENFSGRIYRTRGNPFNSVPWDTTTVVSTEVGTATLSFDDRSNGSFSYTLDGITQSKQIARITFGSGPLTACNNP